MEQTQDCTLTDLEPKLRTVDPIEAAEKIVAGMPNPPRFVIYDVANTKPNYHPTHDRIMVPSPGRYDDVTAYYSTLFHEMIHSTGHPDRLNRPSMMTLDYHDNMGFEEMVAGMGAAILCDHAGITRQTIQSNASYIDSWKSAVNADKKMVVRAAQHAQKAVDYILQYDPTFPQDFYENNEEHVDTYQDSQTIQVPAP